MKLQTGGHSAVRFLALPAFGLAICIWLLGAGGQASAGVPPAFGLAGKVERAVLDDTANGKSTSFMVLMTSQADTSPAYGIKDQDARGWYVYNTLEATAGRTQAGVQALLKAQGVSYRSFWAVNALAVTGNRALVEALAARMDVGKIESNRPFKGIDDPIGPMGPAGANSAPQTVEWNVQNVNAPQVWAMGYTGQGIVIGNQDTGMRWSHNALKPHYRGWNGSVADHNYNWWDAIHTGGGSCGPNSLFPCDDYGHGTHTTGTTSGDDGTGNQIGVAPGAKWIGCRNMDQGNGTPASYTECFQFFMAPTDLSGNNPNPALRPHVMNNSWGCTSGEGCAPGTLQTVVENTQASGIFVEASAGNSGSSCGTVSDPPALYAATFSTGAIDSANNLAFFSSRGPVTADGSNRLKPNISAPGSGVRSATFSSDSSYGSLSGTSMAGPHVVGVVALLWSAHPELSRMITETKNLLQNTANPNVIVNPVQTCGGIPSTTIPNNSFGYGRVDALAAVNGAGGLATPTPTTTGTQPTSTPTRTPTITSTRTSCPTSTPTYTPTRTSCPTTAPTNTFTPIGTVSRTSTPNRSDTAVSTNTAVSGTPTPTPTSVCPPSFGGVQITDFTFTPMTLTVYTGATVRWVNFGPTTHTSTSDTGVWDSGNLAMNDFYQRIFDTPGVYPYHCTIHPGMVGSVTVLVGCPPTSTPTRTSSPVRPSPTSCPVLQPTNTFTPSSGPTNTPTATYTPTGTPAQTGTRTVTPTGTPCAIAFTDVHTTDYFYQGVGWLYCHAAISGYGDNTFRPFNNTTRGQMVKIVVLAYGTPNYAPPSPTFNDVPTTDPFYAYIETAAYNNIVSGYNCGGPGEPCPGVYFRPADLVTRGQLSKIVVVAAGWILIRPDIPWFSDVPRTDAFYAYIETSFCHQVISGYDCGAPGEPCPGQYFRPGGNATRGQIAKMVYNAISNLPCSGSAGAP